jgi:hypothetical protein
VDDRVGEAWERRAGEWAAWARTPGWCRHRAGHRLVGLDSSPALAALAREAGGYDRVLQADATAVPLADGAVEELDYSAPQRVAVPVESGGLTMTFESIDRPLEVPADRTGHRQAGGTRFHRSVNSMVSKKAITSTTASPAERMYQV